jgi:RHS repeat-associated protein
LVSRTVGVRGTVHYVYGLDGELLAEADGATGAIQREYMWLPAEEAMGAEDEGAAPAVAWPIAMVSGVNTATPSLLSVHADHLGRPIMLTDSTKAQVWQAVYKPFGEIFSSSGAVEQNLRFPGQYFMIETGLAYNWHRFYDATTGRYTQPDPLRFVDGPSVYGYAGASPLMRVDPTGLFNPLSWLPSWGAVRGRAPLIHLIQTFHLSCPPSHRPMPGTLKDQRLLDTQANIRITRIPKVAQTGFPTQMDKDMGGRIAREMCGCQLARQQREMLTVVPTGTYRSRVAATTMNIPPIERNMFGEL